MPLARDLKIRCDALGCKRGVVWRDGGWADPCALCEGRGSISLAALCEKIGECETTVAKLLKPRAKMRAKVVVRIFEKLALLLDPPKIKQPDLFA